MDVTSRYSKIVPTPSWDSRDQSVTYAVFRNPTPSTLVSVNRHLWHESDRWDLLAYRYLGDATQWHVLLDHNPHVQDPHFVDPGTVIDIPVFEVR